MGELSRNDAELKKERYMEKLEKAKKHVREDFLEMDFENAEQRERMGEHIGEIEARLSALQRVLGEMSFE